MIALLFTLFTYINEIMPVTVFDFNKNSDISNWYVVDDVVMGGRSYGRLSIDLKGNGVFKGNVSLENNGGFSSLRYRFKKQKIDQYQNLVLYLKGDGKKYQIRIKENSRDYYSFVYNFRTSGKWEKIELDLNDLVPYFRGRRLNMDNYSGKYLEEVGFFIGNKRAERLRLEIDKIELQ